MNPIFVRPQGSEDALDTERRLAKVIALLRAFEGKRQGARRWLFLAVALLWLAIGAWFTLGSDG